MSKQLITDKERMDWLSRRTGMERFYSNHGTTFEESVTRLFTFEVNGEHGTLRQAVDARIMAERLVSRKA